MKGSVFVIGAGFIDGDVLDLLVEEGYRISMLVRRKEAADEFKAMGVTPVMRFLEDTRCCKTSKSSTLMGAG